VGLSFEERPLKEHGGNVQRHNILSFEERIIGEVRLDNDFSFSYTLSN
jgi:hypothetical protein